MAAEAKTIHLMIKDMSGSFVTLDIHEDATGGQLLTRMYELSPADFPLGLDSLQIKFEGGSGQILDLSVRDSLASQGIVDGQMLYLLVDYPLTLTYLNLALEGTPEEFTEFLNSNWTTILQGEMVFNSSNGKVGMLPFPPNMSGCSDLFTPLSAILQSVPKMLALTEITDRDEGIHTKLVLNTVHLLICQQAKSKLSRILSLLQNADMKSSMLTMLLMFFDNTRSNKIRNILANFFANLPRIAHRIAGNPTSFSSELIDAILRFIPDEKIVEVDDQGQTALDHILIFLDDYPHSKQANLAKELLMARMRAMVMAASSASSSFGRRKGKKSMRKSKKSMRKSKKSVRKSKKSVRKSKKSVRKGKKKSRKNFVP
jgi:hypothetical protein